MKKYILGLIACLLCIILVGCDKTEITETTNSSPLVSFKEEDQMKISITVNDHNLTATLENNAAAKEFYDLAKEGLTLELSEYGGFEKVGPIGKTLSSNDKRITANPGDLILYSSDQLSLMYGSNTWSYTRLGTIDNLDQINLASILGNGNIKVTFNA